MSSMTTAQNAAAAAGSSLCTDVVVLLDVDERLQHISVELFVVVEEEEKKDVRTNSNAAAAPPFEYSNVTQQQQQQSSDGVVDLMFGVEDGNAKTVEDSNQQQQLATHYCNETSDDDMHKQSGPVCAVCLSVCEYDDLSLVRGCMHPYCIGCILDWAAHKKFSDKNQVPCPTCKVPFEYLLTRRSLDGQQGDELLEEPVSLLLRASWFVKGKEAIRHGAEDYAMEEDADDYAYAYEEDDYDYDERFLRGRASHRQIILGNRRFGAGGYVQAGRMSAVPRQHNHAKKGKGGCGIRGNDGEGGSSSSSMARNQNQCGGGKYSGSSTQHGGSSFYGSPPRCGNETGGGNRKKRANSKSPGDTLSPPPLSSPPTVGGGQGGTPGAGRRARRKKKKQLMIQQGHSF